MKVISLVLIGALISSCSNQVSQTTTMPVSASARTSDSSLSTRVFTEVNAYRRSQGANNLVRHAGLDRLAQDHCEYLLQHRGEYSLHGKNVSHMGFEGRSLAAREKYNMPYFSENVASTSGGGSSAAPVLINLWKGSPNHHHNMKSNWTYSGVGSVIAPDGLVISVQLFGTIANSQMQSLDRFRRF